MQPKPKTTPEKRRLIYQQADQIIKLDAKITKLRSCLEYVRREWETGKITGTGSAIGLIQAILEDTK